MKNYDLSLMKQKFTNTFQNDGWHMGSGESKSGLGSSLEYTISFRDNLVRIINQYKIEKIFDCSCGDWNWMKEIKNFLPEYIGNDIVEPLVEENNQKFGTDKIKFVSNDMLSQMKLYEDKYFDLIICRHTLEHLVNDYCFDVINEIKRVTKYAIITSTNTSETNLEIQDMNGAAARMINLEASPFVDMIGNCVGKFYDSIGEEQSVGCFGYLYEFKQ
jgi:ubiquinone/menaquinone biosynthesis C-methylase UbiE